MVQVLGDTDRDITSADISKMYLLEQCIYETMRLYPVVPILARTAIADVALGQLISSVSPFGDNFAQLFLLNFARKSQISC